MAALQCVCVYASVCVSKARNKVSEQGFRGKAE